MNFKRQELNRQSFCKCTLRFHEIFFRIFRSLFWIFWRKSQLERKASCSLQSANFSVLISKLTNQRRFDESRDVEKEIYWVKYASNMRQTENLRTVVLSNLLYLGLAQLHLHSLVKTLVKTGRKITKYKNFRNPWFRYLLTFYGENWNYFRQRILQQCQVKFLYIFVWYFWAFISV